MSGEPLLEVTDLVKYFPIKEGLLIDREVAQVRAVDGVSLSVNKGETLGLVGESGCGKSTLCRTMIQLLAPTSGSVRFEGREIGGLSRRQMRPLRREMQMIFQDPYASLNPRKRVGQIVGDPLKLHGIASGGQLKRQVQELLERVGLSSEHYNRYPHEFSGGQRQRIGIARALALRPKLIVADEPVSALDVSIQAQIINLLDDLQDEFGLTYIFVAHDLGVVRHVSDRIAVMYLGKVVENAPADRLYSHPVHPYTAALLSAVPIPDPRENRSRHQMILEGDVPSPIDPPAACRFHTRCPRATEICSEPGAGAEGARPRRAPGRLPPSAGRGRAGRGGRVRLGLDALALRRPPGWLSGSASTGASATSLAPPSPRGARQGAPAPVASSSSNTMPPTCTGTCDSSTRGWRSPGRCHAASPSFPIAAPTGWRCGPRTIPSPTSTSRARSRRASTEAGRCRSGTRAPTLPRNCARTR